MLEGRELNEVAANGLLVAAELKGDCRGGKRVFHVVVALYPQLFCLDELMLTTVEAHDEQAITREGGVWPCRVL